MIVAMLIPDPDALLRLKGMQTLTQRFVRQGKHMASHYKRIFCNHSSLNSLGINFDELVHRTSAHGALLIIKGFAVIFKLVLLDCTCKLCISTSGHREPLPLPSC